MAESDLSFFRYCSEEKLNQGIPEHIEELKDIKKERFGK